MDKTSREEGLEKERLKEGALRRRVFRNRNDQLPSHPKLQAAGTIFPSSRLIAIVNQAWWQSVIAKQVGFI